MYGSVTLQDLSFLLLFHAPFRYTLLLVMLLCFTFVGCSKKYGRVCALAESVICEFDQQQSVNHIRCILLVSIELICEI